jgi:hypothetical protein
VRARSAELVESVAAEVRAMIETIRRAKAKENQSAEA